MSRAVGRLALLSEVQGLLAQATSVVLYGPTGIGKSAFLDHLAESSNGRIIRAAGAASEHSMAFAVLQDLLDQLPEEAEVPEPLRGVLDHGLVGADLGDDLRCILSCAVKSLLERLADEGEVLVLIDDLHWVDSESAAVIGFARRRLAGRVGFVGTIGPDAPGTCIEGWHSIEMMPLEVSDLIDLLSEHGLPAHVAQRLHTESGGLPSLALALCGAIVEQPSLLGRPTPPPPRLQQVLRERFLAQPAAVRTTLEHAALLHRPTIRHLERAGRIAAEEHIRRAVQAGMVTRTDGVVRFTPPALQQIVVDLAAASCLTQLHNDLAAVVPTVAEQMRHRALGDPRPNPELARRLADTARDAAAAGDWEIATELYVLAADRAPCVLREERQEWLATAIETGAPGNHADLVHRALADLLASAATPQQLVRVRLALPELTGSGVAAMDEVLTAALADAGDDDRLVGMVLLQRARVALMESQPAVAVGQAGQAVRLLRRSGDGTELAMALTTLAVATRWTGDGGHDDHLREALTLARICGPGLVHVSPAYIAARFAFYDDRLDEAWSAFRGMLVQLERGAVMDQLHVLRCLVEVGTRLGRCREAMEYAARAARVAEEFDLDPYLSWFVTAVAELAGGDLARARTFAERGILAAEEGGDNRYLQRHLLLLGQAQLRSGDAQGARDTLQRIRDIEESHGIADPTVNRWQAELVAALVMLGELDEADAVLVDARRRLEDRAGTSGVTAQLDRAEAQVLGARGDVEGALVLLDRSEKVCADLGMQIDVGRVLLTRAHLDRRRRRAAAARVSLDAAQSLFTAIHAHAWSVQAGSEPTTTTTEGLTETEARIAAEVAAGASNREIAERLFLSVKTVEATLTRIYRKLGIRSRTQLATLVAPPESPGQGISP